MDCRRIACLLIAASATAGLVRAGEVQVAVAANFAAPLAKIGEGFSAATGHGLKTSAGATGKFQTQIAAGAPFELLLAADDETPRKLVADGLAVAGSNFSYAIGRLVLWSAQPGVVDEQGAVLAARGLATALAPKLVSGESIAQTYQFVATGNAELGFVAWSQVAVPGKPVAGSHWLVPSSLHREIRQDAVLLKAGENNPAATALLAYLKTDAARAVMRSFGYAN